MDILKTISMIKQYKMIREARALVRTTFKSTISKEFNLEKFLDAIDYYRRNMTEGKVLLRPFLGQWA